MGSIFFLNVIGQSDSFSPYWSVPLLFLSVSALIGLLDFAVLMMPLWWVRFAVDDATGAFDFIFYPVFLSLRFLVELHFRRIPLLWLTWLVIVLFLLRAGG